MDLDLREVALNKKRIALRPKEFDLLRMFLLKPNIVVHRKVVLEDVFKYNPEVTTRTIDTHMKNLRRSLNPWSKRIKTVFGIGFKLVCASKVTQFKRGKR
jgi:DNA-binding response OmpR family regulator